VAIAVTASLLFLMLPITGGLLQRSYLAKEYEEKSSTELVSMRDDRTWGGSFFLAIGSIGERDYFMYYSKNDLGEFRKRKIYYENAIIHEDNTSPRLVIVKVHSDNPFLLPFISYEEFHFYVPQGSIIREFSLD